MDWSKATTYIHSNGKKRRTAFSLSLLKARRNMWGQWGFVPTYFRQKCTLTLYITSQNLGYLQCTEYILIFKFSKLLGDMNTPDELFKSETTLLIRGYRLSPRHLQHLIWKCSAVPEDFESLATMQVGRGAGPYVVH